MRVPPFQETSIWLAMIYPISDTDAVRLVRLVPPCQALIRIRRLKALEKDYEKKMQELLPGMSAVSVMC